MYGSYNKVFNYLWIFAFLADLGLYTIAVREISLGKDAKEKIIGNVLTLRTVLWCIIWIWAFLLALILPWYWDTSTLWAIFIIGAFTVVSLMNSTFLALMQSQMKIEFSLISLIAGKIINLGLVAYFLIILLPITGDMGAWFISVFIAALVWISLTTYLNYLYARRLCSIKFLFDTTYISHIFKISLPYGIALFLSVVYFKIDVILLSLLEDPSQANISIALYGLPMKIVEVLMVVGAFYMNAVLPSMTQDFKTGSYKKLWEYIPISLKVLWSFWVFILVSGSLFAEEIIRIIANAEYISPLSSIYSSLDALYIVLWVLIFHFLSLVFIYLYIATNRQSELLYINAWITMFNIIWNILFIPYYSFLWAGIVTLLSQILLMWISFFVIRRDIDISLRDFKPLLVSVLLGGGMFLVWSHVKTIYSFSDIGNIILYWIPLLVGYVLWEYMLSRKLILSLR